MMEYYSAFGRSHFTPWRNRREGACAFNSCIYKSVNEASSTGSDDAVQILLNTLQDINPMFSKITIDSWKCGCYCLLGRTMVNQFYLVQLNQTLHKFTSSPLRNTVEEYIISAKSYKYNFMFWITFKRTDSKLICYNYLGLKSESRSILPQADLMIEKGVKKRRLYNNNYKNSE